MLSTLQHFAYCPTQAWLIWDGVWLDNHLTVSGDMAHSRVDTVSTDHRRGVRAHHRVPIASNRLRVQGIADTIEEHQDGRLIPVEHKLGRGAGDLFPSIAQVVAQALCVEEMAGVSVDECALFIVAERRREQVMVKTHRARVEELIAEARATLIAPPREPIFNAKLCRSCSVRNSCQPKGVGWV